MTRLVSRHPIDSEALLSTERDDIVLEERRPDGSFGAVDGPFSHYHRTVRRDGDELVEEIDYRLAIPYVSWLFAWPVRHHLLSNRARTGSTEQPWWSPPERINPRASAVLALLAVASLAVGYLNTLLTQTVTYAAEEFGATSGDQARALAIVRSGIVIALVVVSIADKRGRRKLILFTAVTAPVFASLGAMAPNLGLLTATQAVGRPLALSLDMVIAIVAAEEMPKGSRAYAFSLLALATGLGAGLCVMALPLAGLGVQAWRLIYVFPLAFLFVVRPLARQLPESRRFTAPHDRTARLRDHLGRFALLATAGLFINLLVAPASGLQNDYLRTVRGFSPSLISLFTLATQTPAGVGVMVGGELADRYGRRIVGAFALTVGTIATVFTYIVTGPSLWVWSLIGATIGGAAVPALGVYQTELFPTAIRGRAKSGIVVITLVGSSIGLLGAAAARDNGVSYGRIMTVLAIGPLLVSLLVLFAYPETARRELEQINPEDAGPSAL